MATQETADLEDLILQVLKSTGSPLSIRQIEEKLAKNGRSFDTFAVRDTVWRLVSGKRAAFTPRRHVRLAS
jgi:hypothetical protein